MTAKYLAILTNQGAARLANAAALGTKLNLTQMAVGDANGTLPTPDPAQTKLINQKRIAPLNLLTVDPANTSQIIAEQIIPENEGGFWIREIGLYDDDGILIAVANCPETYKPQLQEGSGRTQTIRMILIVSSTSSITLKIDPSVVLATRKYADDKAIELKLYVDDLMSKHLAAADPHSQYATKDSPTFTGKPKAPTPPVVANDTQVATAGFVQAVIAALVSGELANKQPLDKTLTDLSGKDVAAILEYLGLEEVFAKKNSSDPLTTGTLHINPFGDVTSCAFHREDGSYVVIETSVDGSMYLVNVNKDGVTTGKITFPAGYGTLLTKGQADNHYPLKTDLGTAAKKNTGAGAGQIPDMSYFISTKTSSAIVEQLPTGIIRMSGVALVSTDVNGNCWVQLPSTFPNKVMFYAGEQNGSNYAGDSSPWLFTPYTNDDAGVTRLSFAVRRSTTGEVMKNDTISMKFTAEGY